MAVSLGDAVFMAENGWLGRFVLLSILLTATALFALLTAVLLILKKPRVTAVFAGFSILWLVTSLDFDYNVAVMGPSESERIIWLIIGIVVPILLGYGLVRKTLALRYLINQPN